MQLTRILALFLLLPNITMASDIIFKCTNGDSISYITFPNNKPNVNNCIVTDFGGDSIGTNNSIPKSKNINSNNNIPLSKQAEIIKPVSSEVQQKRDLSRNSILNQELELEKKYVSEITQKISTAKKTEDISSLNNELTSHTKNVLALQKSLGIN